MHPTYQGGDEAVVKQMHTGIWDTRMLQNTIDHLNVLNRSDVELGCFLNLNGLDGSTWALRNTRTPANSPQIDAVLRFNSSTPLAVDYRTAPPFVRPGASYDTREWEVPALAGTGSATLTANAAYNMSYAFHTPSAGNYTVTVNYATTAAATFAVELDGNLLATFTPGSTAGSVVATAPATAACTPGRMHSVRIVVLAGTVSVHSISVSPAAVTALKAPASMVATSVLQGPEIFPNPARGMLNLRLPMDSRRIQLSDLSGRLLRTLTASPGLSRLDISTFPPGIYVITVVAADGRRSNLRFVKE